MTRIRVHGPDIEADVSAEQMTAYLLDKGWRDTSLLPDSTLWRKFSRGGSSVDVPLNQGLADHGALMAECIRHIARAEGRHPSAVLADIVGPAVGVDGVRCAVGMDGPWLWGGCNRLDGKCGDGAAHGAGEESEER